MEGCVQGPSWICLQFRYPGVNAIYGILANSVLKQWHFLLDDVHWNVESLISNVRARLVLELRNFGWLPAVQVYKKKWFFFIIVGCPTYCFLWITCCASFSTIRFDWRISIKNSRTGTHHLPNDFSFLTHEELYCLSLFWMQTYRNILYISEETLDSILIQMNSTLERQDLIEN